MADGRKMTLDEMARLLRAINRRCRQREGDLSETVLLSLSGHEARALADIATSLELLDYYGAPAFVRRKVAKEKEFRAKRQKTKGDPPRVAGDTEFGEV